LVFVPLIVLVVVRLVKGRPQSPESHLAHLHQERTWLAQQEHALAVAHMQQGVPDEINGQLILGYCVDVQKPSLQAPLSDKAWQVAADLVRHPPRFHR
jgi:hypothetical protein